MVARPWSSSRLSCGGRLLLRCYGNAGNSFPNTQGNDPSSRARRRKGDSSGCGQDSRASSRMETGMWGNFLSCVRCSGLTTGTSGTRSGGIRKGQSPCELLVGLSGFLSRRCQGLRPCVESVPEPEDSSPVLTWILGYSGVSPGESVLISSGGIHVRFPPEL